VLDRIDAICEVGLDRLELIENEFGVEIHGPELLAESGEMVVVDLVGLQGESISGD